MTRDARAVIDLAALRHNFQRARVAAPKSRVLAVIKANAYGHGLITIAQALDAADGFGVACVNEAVRLREAGIKQTIVCLQGFKDSDELDEACARRIDVAVHTPYQLDMLARARLERPARVWLKLDTGMGRLGFAPQQAGAVYLRLREMRQVATTITLMTHLAGADDRDSDGTPQQLTAFERAVEALSGARSVANSAGILAWPNSHRDWVRPGIMLYGGTPFEDDDAAQHGLRPVMTLTAPLLAVKSLAAGDAVGYAGTWVCPEAMRVGVVASGYADGYPRHAQVGTPILINGRLTQLIGRVGMDMITIDLRGCEAQAGDRVTLWGRGLAVDTVARCAGTVSYELMCAVGGRVRTEFVQ
jgi:alanine racemase